MHTYRITLRNGSEIVGNDAYLTRRFGSWIWDHYGEIVDHNIWCRCRRNNPITLPPDPFGNPDKIVSPF